MEQSPDFGSRDRSETLPLSEYEDDVDTMMLSDMIQWLRKCLGISFVYASLKISLVGMAKHLFSLVTVRWKQHAPWKIIRRRNLRPAQKTLILLSAHDIQPLSFIHVTWPNFWSFTFRSHERFYLCLDVYLRIVYVST